MGLFTHPDDWKKARGPIQVFKFYSQAVLRPDAAPCPSCGANVLPNLASAGAFVKLRSWGIAIAVETPALKPWGCTADVTGSFTRSALDNVRAAGGSVRYVAMDEPLLGGAACGYAPRDSATQTAAYVRQVHEADPSVLVGDIEPYPRFSVVALEDWLSALAAQGASPAFFHLDVDHAFADLTKSDVDGDLRAMQSFCAARGIPFGVLLTSLKGGSDRAYYDDATAWIRRVEIAIGRPEHVVFQSFAQSADGSFVVPVNLPDSDPAVFSHTRLVAEGLAILKRP